MCATERVGGGT